MSVNYDIDEICVATKNGETLKERYGFFYTKITELTNGLILKFECDEPAALKWKIQLGKEVAEIHHQSHTWCFCDFDKEMKRINESETPVYLGTIPINELELKTWQDNNLQSNEVIIEGALNTITKTARLLVEGLNFSK